MKENNKASVAAALPLIRLGETNQALRVAHKVCAFIECSEIDPSDPATLEGLLLAMLMVGGPQKAANVLRYCSFSRD